MSPLEEVLARIESGANVKPAEYLAARTAAELEMLAGAAEHRRAVAEDAAARVGFIEFELGAKWDLVDKLTDSVEVASAAFEKARIRLCQVVEELRTAGQDSRSFVGHNEVTEAEIPARNGRGVYEPTAFGGTSYIVQLTGGGYEVRDVPVTESYHIWVRNRRGEGRGE